LKSQLGVQLTLTASTLVPAVARHTAVAFLRGLVAEECVADVELAVSELVTNMTQHSPEGGTLSLSLDDETLRVEVSDRAREPVRPQAAPAVGGRGLRIVECLAHRWGTTRADDRPGNLVWCEFAVSPRPELLDALRAG
jgi:anti-sigma regulatory factor (Ser/Thr protein kinase)